MIQRKDNIMQSLTAIKNRAWKHHRQPDYKYHQIIIEVWVSFQNKSIGWPVLLQSAQLPSKIFKANRNLNLAIPDLD